MAEAGAVFRYLVLMILTVPGTTVRRVPNCLDTKAIPRYFGFGWVRFCSVWVSLTAVYKVHTFVMFEAFSVSNRSVQVQHAHQDGGSKRCLPVFWYSNILTAVPGTMRRVPNCKSEIFIRISIAEGFANSVSGFIRVLFVAGMLVPEC